MSSPQHEPTMEEILASIRKIISEDNPPEAAPAAAAPKPAAAPAPAPVPEPVQQPEMEVLELTQEVAEPPAPEPVPEPPQAEEIIEERTDEIVFEPITAREPTPTPASENDIFSDRTRQALEDTFDSLPDGSDEPVARPGRAATAADGSSVESVFERAVRESFEPVLQKYLQDNSQLVIERMKPLIREWMDENFPALLENAVRGEVERIVKARTRR
jgi:cell pole-organizing protein PopZ